MRTSYRILSLFLLSSVMLFSCKRELETGILNRGNFDNRPPGLKSEFDFPIGTAISYTPFTTINEYANIAASDFDLVTFEYEMKHGAIVRNNGSFDFTRADQLVNLAEAGGLGIFGHTLVWHQNQNAEYLNTLTVGGGGSNIVNLIENPGFENGLTGWSVVNTGNPAGASKIELTTTASQVRSGTSALRVITDQSYGTSQWRVQAHSPAFNARAGVTYTISFWIKAATAGGSIRLSATPTGTVSNAYQGDQDNIGTDWTQVSWNITMTSNEPNQRISFDMGKAANTYFIDDVLIFDPNAPPPPPLLANGGLEGGLTGWAAVNTGNPAGSSSIALTNAPNQVRSGTNALRILVDQNYGTSQWRVQAHTPTFAAEAGKTYNISFWIKAANTGGSVRLSAAPTGAVVNAYQGDQDGIGTDWTQINWTITMNANEPNQRISFDIGKVANTYYIDDVVIQDAAAAGGGGGGNEAVEQKVDEAMKNYITTMMTRYKGKVKAWDVVNEPMTEAGALRTDANTTVPQGATDFFFWSKYLGRDYAFKAFQYAAETDPDALLFINEFNLETSRAKLDSLIAFVKEMRDRGAKIDGIGTQMHISWNTTRAGIDEAFRKLAETGLQVRISELDVRVNPGAKPDFVLTPQFEAYQATMYEYVIQSYIKHVPPAQRHGITIWGVSDNLSWLFNDGRDFPLLYNADFTRKAAYGGVLNGTRQQ